MIVAIDGPSGAGKGTISKALARKLNIIYVDTGAMYRCLALKCKQLNVNSKDEILKVLNEINIELKQDGKVYLDKNDVSKEIREEDISMLSSNISVYPEVREVMVLMQRKMGENNSVVMEGRDITTVVFKNADYKFYLDATIEERARRRSKENHIDINEVKKDLEKRDYNDMHKKVGALKRTKDQIYIDSSNLSIDEVVNKMLEVIK